MCSPQQFARALTLLGSPAPPVRPASYPPPSIGLHGSILRAGALWLIGVCGGELQPAPWAEACTLTVQHLAHADVVVSGVGCNQTIGTRRSTWPTLLSR